MQNKQMQKMKDKFAQKMIDRIIRAGLTDKARYDKDNFILSFGKSGLLLLGYAFQKTRNMSEREREAFIRRWLRGYLVMQKVFPHDLAEAKPDLYPKLELRNEVEVGKLRERLRICGYANCPYHIIGEHLALTVVYECPDSIGWFGNNHLKEWNITFDELVAIAKNNLSGMAKPVFVSPAPGCFVSRGDEYNATRMIYPDIFNALPVKGIPVVMPLNERTLVVAGSDDVSGLSAMLRVAANVTKNRYSVTKLTFVLEGDHWRQWLPRTDHPLHGQFYEIERTHWRDAYGRQQVLLEKLLESNVEWPLRGAPTTFYEYEGNPSLRNLSINKPFSLSLVIGTSIPLSIPKTDFVSFSIDTHMRPDELVFVKWQSVIDILGNTIQVEDIYPPRFLVNQFPTGTAWDQIRASCEVME